MSYQFFFNNHPIEYPTPPDTDTMMKNKTFSMMLPFLVLLLPIPVIVSYALVLAGCVSTSPGIPSIYLAKLVWKGKEATDFSIRVGYYGICADLPEKRTCAPTVYGTKVAILESILFSRLDTSDVDMEAAKDSGILQMALDLQFKIFHSLIVASALLFVIGIIALAVYAYIPGKASPAPKPKPSRRKSAALIALLLSCAMCLAATVSVTQVGNALEWATARVEAPITIKRGTAVQVLQWIALGFSVLFAGAASLWAAKKDAPEAGQEPETPMTRLPPPKKP